MAQTLTFLPCKCENLSFIPRAQKKSEEPTGVKASPTLMGSWSRKDECGRRAYRQETPSKGVMISQSILLAYSLAVLLLQSVLLSIPSFCTSVAWMPINIMHNLAICVFLHTVKDSLPATLNQGSSVFDTLGAERLLLLPTFSSASLLFYSTHKAPYAPSTTLLASLSDCCLSVTYTK